MCRLGDRSELHIAIKNARESSGSASQLSPPQGLEDDMANVEIFLARGSSDTDLVTLQSIDTEEIEATCEQAAKKCFVCLEEIPDVDEAHQTLSPECGIHIWMEKEFICTDCLRKHLYHRMFPLNQEGTERKFPSIKVRCWSFHCHQILSHATIQKYAEAEAFNTYDRELCQLYLEQTKSTLRCAFENCDGAEWTDNAECEKSRIFHCPSCGRDTCLECNGPYQMHLDRPCPVGKDARNPIRIKLAETRSKLKLKTKNKCPQCPLRYEKMGGCDHIVCGSRYSVNDFPGKSYYVLV